MASGPQAVPPMCIAPAVCPSICCCVLVVAHGRLLAAALTAGLVGPQVRCGCRVSSALEVLRYSKGLVTQVEDASQHAQHMEAERSPSFIFLIFLIFVSSSLPACVRDDSDTSSSPQTHPPRLSLLTDSVITTHSCYCE